MSIRDSSDGQDHGTEIAPRVRVPDAALRWAFSRSSGPGGQNVNKLSTKAELRVSVEDLPLSWRAIGRLRGIAGRRIIGSEKVVDEMGRSHERGGEIVITSDSERSQQRNKSECMQLLRELVVQAMVEPKVRRKTRPTRGSVERRIEGKARRSDIKKGRRGGGEE